MTKEIRLILSAEEANIRLDKLVSSICEDMSRSYVQSIIKDGDLLVNNEKSKPSYITKENDFILIKSIPVKNLEIAEENIELDILYEDNSILIVNKPKNMVVHPAAGHYTGTLVNAIMYHCKGSLSNINGVLRPGIVHRIDKNTTGALVVCKNDFSHNFIAAQLKEHSINRKYIGIVKGSFRDKEGVIEAPIGRDKKNRLRMAVDRLNGKDAVTYYRVLEPLENASLMEFRLKTGRTHQIRVHMSSIGHSLLGDSLYGESRYSDFTKEQCLHAWTLGFVHPETKAYIDFCARIPEYMIELHKRLGGKLNLKLLNGDSHE